MWSRLWLWAKIEKTYKGKDKRKIFTAQLKAQEETESLYHRKKKQKHKTLISCRYRAGITWQSTGPNVKVFEFQKKIIRTAKSPIKNTALVGNELDSEKWNGAFGQKQTRLRHVGSKAPWTFFFRRDIFIHP